MRIFALELKKFLNWKILLAVVALGALFYWAYLSSSVFAINNGYGAFGQYGREMFEQYGESLSADEYADFDTDGKVEFYTAQLDALIANEPLFPKYGISSYAEWKKEESAFFQKYGTMTENGNWNLDDPYSTDLAEFQRIVYESDGYREQKDAYSRLVTLEYIAHYLSPEKNATRMYFRDERPVVVHKTESYVSAPDVSLISAWLTSNFSFYAAVTGIFAVIAVLILVAPFVTNERSRKMQYLQYSSSIGRKLFRTQFAVSVVAATLAGAAIIAVLYGLCFAQTNIEDYLNCSTALHTNDGFYMYDVTFGQYVVILAAMTLLLCICAACLAFVLGWFSSNAVNLMLKTVPVGAAVATIAALAMNRLFSPSNYVFNNLFTNRLNIEYMEVIICAMLAVIGAVVEAVVMVREKRVDVA